MALRKKLSEERVIRKYVAKTLHTPLKQVQIERGSMRTWWDWGKRGSATALVENRKFEVSWECLTLTHDGIEFLMLYSPVCPFCGIKLKARRICHLADFGEALAIEAEGCSMCKHEWDDMLSASKAFMGMETEGCSVCKSERGVE